MYNHIWYTIVRVKPEIIMMVNNDENVSLKINPSISILGLSHINVVVDDIELATEFYSRTLGFTQAYNKDGIMDYSVTSTQFAVDAGFLDGNVQLQVRFLNHPTAGIYLELMQYHNPKGSQKITFYKTNDLGGVRHVALEVANVNEMFNFLKQQPDVKMINESVNYGPPKYLPSDFKLAFFYWLDPWGVQWEMEEGRPIGTIKGIIG